MLWSVVNIPSKTPSEKLTFSFASRYHLQIASWLGVGVQVHFALSVLGLEGVFSKCTLGIWLISCLPHLFISPAPRPSVSSWHDWFPNVCFSNCYLCFRTNMRRLCFDKLQLSGSPLEHLQRWLLVLLLLYVPPSAISPSHFQYCIYLSGFLF